MSTNITVSFEEVFEKLDNDPEFSKAERKIKPYYDLVVEIIKRRKALNISQAELARKAKTHQSRISRIEAAEDDFRLSTLIRIAEALESQIVINLVPLPHLEESQREENYQYFVEQTVNVDKAQSFSIELDDDLEELTPIYSGLR
jgi:transcriptional regulator with XRE-family HTH domain